MGQYDRQWTNIIDKITMTGTWQKPEHVRGRYESDGAPAPTKFVTGEKMVFVNTSEALIPTTKKFKKKGPLRELFWIWMMKSNVVQDLRDLGSSIWDNWEIKEGEWAGTIGPAYGYQLGKVCRKFPLDKFNWEHAKPGQNYKYDSELNVIYLDQVDFLIQTLLTNTGSRRLVTSLWDVDMLDEMALEPCVWKTSWQYVDGNLDLIVGIRSNDMCLGNPFNVYQYQVLHRIMCQICKLHPGKLQFDIDNPHIYDRHIEEAIAQSDYPSSPAPKLWINPKVTNFYRFDMDNDVKIIESDQYKYYTNAPERIFEVAE
jgi:thymidylate synthase